MATRKNEILENLKNVWGTLGESDVKYLRGGILEIAANELEKDRCESEIIRIASISNERLKSLELRKLILTEHGKEFDLRDLIKIVAETVLDVAIAQERIASTIEQLTIKS